MKIKPRCFNWERNRVNDGSESAKAIREEIERLSDFKLEPVGTSPEGGYIDNLNPTSEHLDYAVSLNGKIFAELDTTGSNYTFAGSKIMPVKRYKGEKVKKLPIACFFVYLMKMETGPVKDRCYWIRGVDVVKCEHSVDELGGKPQDNYLTEKSDWNRGLDALFEEFRRESDNQ